VRGFLMTLLWVYGSIPEHELPCVSVDVIEEDKGEEYDHWADHLKGMESIYRRSLASS
jgi:hypothetical protein